MKRFRFAILALCVLALASVTSAATPVPAPSADRFCNKLCAIGFHCVPTPSGGKCVPGNGVTATAPTVSAQVSEADDSIVTTDSNATTDSVEATDAAVTPGVAADDCLAAANDGDSTTSKASSHCPPCTILCPVGTHPVQNGKCECKCVGNAG